MKAILLLLLFVCAVEVRAEAQEASFSDTMAALGTTMALLLTENQSKPTNEARDCGLVGVSTSNNYLRITTEAVAKTKTLCQLHQELSSEVKRVMPVFSSCQVTGVGQSALQRFVDDACANPASAVPPNQDDGARLRGAAAAIFLSPSPMGSVVASVLIFKGIFHETSPDRLKEQLNSWITKPGDALQRGDLHKVFCAATFHIGC